MAIQISAAMKFFEQSGFIRRDLVSKYHIPGNFCGAKFSRNNVLQNKFSQSLCGLFLWVEFCKI